MNAKKARSYPTHLRLLGLALALALAWVAAGAASAAAVDGCKANCATTTYYSDALHHTVVGSYGADVCGNCTGSGQITAYYSIHFFICPDIVCSVNS
jgi:hypothetical protein